MPSPTKPDAPPPPSAPPDGINFEAAGHFLRVASEAHKRGDNVGYVAACKMIAIALKMDMHLAPVIVQSAKQSR